MHNSLKEKKIILTALIESSKVVVTFVLIEYVVMYLLLSILSVANRQFCQQIFQIRNFVKFLSFPNIGTTQKLENVPL